VCEAILTQSALVDAASRLVAARSDLPAGSVLRCFARAVALARRTGVPTAELPARAEALAHELLAARHSPRRSSTARSRRVIGTLVWPQQQALSA
jgi:hypothetical protein